MSINIDVQNEEPGGEHQPDRLSGLLSILLAILLIVSAVVVLLVGRQRSQQLASLQPTATVTKPAQATAPPLSPPMQQTPTTGVQPTPATKSPVTTPTLAGRASPAVPTTATQPVHLATATPTPAAPAATPTAVTTLLAPTGLPDGKTWYFGEGASVPPFRTWYSIYNPGTQAANVTLSLYPETGKALTKTLTIAAGAQTRVLANDMLPTSAFGAGIRSDQPVVVARLTVGDRDGTASAGMIPARTWYFPEGQTGEDFTTWLLVLNPNPTPAAVKVTYYPVGTTGIAKTYTAPPMARLTIAAHRDVPSAVMSMMVESSQPIVVEYAVYFDNQKAAYGGNGSASVGKNWYVASGNTQVGFTGRLAMFNPNKEPAIVRVVLMGSKGNTTTDLYSIEPQSKDDIVMNDQADEQLVAAILESDRPIVVETVTYYLSGGEQGPIAAYSAPALPYLSKQWHLPDMMPSRDYDSYLLLFNPGQATALVTVSYVSSGTTATKTYQVPAQGRTTLRVADEVRDTVVDAVSVRSTEPIVAERIVMFRSSIGAAAAAGIAGQ